MNRIFGVMLSAALLAGSAGAAFAGTEQNCAAQLHAQLQTLQQQVAALQAGGTVQAVPAAAGQIPTGG